MKLSVSRFAVLLCTLAVVLVSAFASVASAFPTLGQAKQLPVVRARAATASSSWADSTSFTVAALTTSAASCTLQVVDMQNVNWHGANAAPGVGTNAYTVGALQFSVSSPGGGDSLTVKYQCSVDGSIWGPQSAVLASTGTAGDAYYKLPFVVTPNTVTNVQPFLAKFIRFIVYGDTGGTFGGVKAYWTPLVETGVPTVGQ